MVVDSKSGYAVLAVWVTVLGIFLMAAPDDWYGPSWSYFAHEGELIVPAGGFGMGMALSTLGVLQMVAVGGERWRVLSLLFGLSGFVFMTAGLLLGAEGLFGHQGLMEAPFMLFVAVHKLVISVNASQRTKVVQEPS
jgi:hypothetical protein